MGDPPAGHDEHDGAADASSQPVAAGAGPSSPKPSPLLPFSFAGGRYEVKTFLGEGTRKRVYLAHDTRLDRDVAIALIKTEGLDEAGRARVDREAREMGRLGDHPHIVTVYDVGETDTGPYVVSQYMAGGDVARLLQQGSEHRLPLADALRIAEQLCRALEYTHARGIIHRDIKPENVWLTADGSAKLGDFGLATARDRGRLTTEGMVVGTVAYMAPEQALGKPLDARSDLYALGAMLYEMVTGRPPFVGDDPLSILSQHIHTPPVAPSWHNPAVPKALEALILRLLAKPPEDRLESAAAVCAALAEIPLKPTAPTVLGRNPLGRLAGGIFVGREREMEELRAAVEDALAGRGRLVLLGGEPGIGKTSIAQEVTTYARLRGFQALWGRCDESGGAPAYWPWVQVIRAYVHDSAPADLVSTMGSGAADIAQVASEVRERLPRLPAPPALDPEQARFRLFDSITTFLKNAGNRQPLVLILDDLQGADKPSLLLLQFLARQIAEARLLVVGAYRDVEVDRQHPLFQILGELVREAVTRRFSLRGLSERDVARYIELTAGVAPPPALVAAVYRETEGNPFFAGEVVRLLVTEGRLEQPEAGVAWRFDIPAGVREAISRRLERLSTKCNSVLALASVAGREFGLNVLEHVSDLPRERLLEALDEAVGARVIAEVAAARYTFSHALICETLYEALTATRRAHLHRQIGEALEGLYRANLKPHLAALAYHFFKAAQRGAADKAIEYAVRAGDRAAALMAHEEAARHYEVALQAFELAAHPDVEQLCDLLLTLSETLWRAGDCDRAKDVAVRAVEVGRSLSGPEHLARAALGFAGRLPMFGAVACDEKVVALLEEGLRALGEEASALRARVMARLAEELTFSHSHERRWALSLQAVEMARRSGDPSVLASVLRSTFLALWIPEKVEARIEVGSEVLRLAGHVGDRVLALEGHIVHLLSFLELADASAIRGEFEVCERLAQELRQPYHLWIMATTRGCLAFMEGRVKEVEALAQEALRLGEESQNKHAGLFSGVQLGHLFWLQGRFQELESLLIGVGSIYPLLGPTVRCALAATYSEEGREAEARREFEGLAANDFSDLPRNPTWLCSVSFLAEACAFLNDARRAERLYKMLLPFTERNVNLAFSLALGSASYYLGILAATMGRSEEAAPHFEDALTTHARLGTRQWLARTQVAYAKLLLARRAQGDCAKAVSLLNEAVEIAQAIGMPHLAQKALALKLEAQGILPAELKPSIDAVASADPRHLVEQALAAKLRAQGVTAASVAASIDAVATAVERRRPDLSGHAAPDGTVTLVFSDMEGFTEMTERLGDKQALEVIGAHNAIVREQVVAHGGTEVELQGDGFLLAFESARRALRFAISLQRAFAAFSEEHPEQPIRVRIGLHTGEALKQADHFFGKTVIVAARIASEAHGGTILVSSVVKELVEGDGEFTFGEGREVKLKGLSGTRQVFEVLWDERPAGERAPALVPERGSVFRCEGEYWTLSFEGAVCRLRDAKGLHHIAQLLRHPGEPFEVRVLVAAREGAPTNEVVVELVGQDISLTGLGDAGAVLDVKAKAAYKRRLDELRAELEEAERFNDLGRAARARDEMEFLTGQLAAAVGLGGRDRAAASAAERARLTVTKSIKAALKKIGRSHPALGHHLATHIRTGYVCSYTPDPGRPVSWAL